MSLPSVTLLSLFSGRWNCLSHYVAGLEHLDYPKDKLEIVWYSNASEIYIEALDRIREILTARGFSIKLISDPSLPPTGLTSQEINAFLGAHFAGDHLNTIAALYNAAWQEVKTDYVFTCEDDIIIPSHSLKKFLSIMEEKPKAAEVMGAMNCRHDNSGFTLLNVWDLLPVVFISESKTKKMWKVCQVDRPVGVKKVATGHLGLNLFKRSRCPEILKRKLPFRAMTKWKGFESFSGLDILLGVELTRAGKEVYCDFETRPYHINSKGHFL